MNRWMIAISSVLICHMFVVASPAKAGEDDRTADEIFADAEQAVEDREYRRALDLLELAERKEPKPQFTYERILVLEELGEYDQALALLDSERRELAGESGVGDLTALEERLQEARTAQVSDDETSGHTDRASTDVLGWSLAATGVAAALGGGGSLLAAESQVGQLRCAGIYPEAQRTGCAGVDAPDQLTRQEFEERSGRIRTLRIVGSSLLGIGAVTTAYATYRLLWGERPARGTARNVYPAVGTNGAFSLQWRWRF
ncbi:MAG: hypothetical protein ACOCV2_08130 [Persicimonas sp.]